MESKKLFQRVRNKAKARGWKACPGAHLMCEAVDSKSRLVHKLLRAKVAVQQSLFTLLLSVII